MMRKLIFTIALAISTSAAVMAQGDGRVANPYRREMHPISSAEIIEIDGRLSLVLRGELPDGCKSPTVAEVQQTGEAFFVDIYRELRTNVECTAIVQPYEERVDVSSLFESGPANTDIRVLVVNSRLFGVEYFEGDKVPLLSNEWGNETLPYDQVVTRHRPDGDMDIELSGSMPDSCAIPVVRAIADWQNPGFVFATARMARPFDAMCMGAVAAFSIVARAPIFDTFSINGVSVPFDPAINTDRQAFREEELFVSGAKFRWVEGILPNLEITVSGMTDGCDEPIQVVPQAPEGNRVVVKVVRVLPEQKACPELAREFYAEFYYSPPLEVNGPMLLQIGQQVLTVNPLR
ncbi:MAG: hypothetical protein IPK52_06195 [Chloroflexi bacterium]|nr:hypothetical protein [Chloroflexota bacterium]